MEPVDLHILTGAPGAGKSAILEALGVGMYRVREPAREVIAEQRAIGGTGTSEQDPALFVELLLRRSIERYVEAIDTEASAALFDRGVPDCIAYAVVLGTDAAPSVAAAARHRYHPEVLLLEPWEQIYVADDERTVSFDDTVPFHDALVDAYTRAGYALVVVPRGSIENRVAFVRDALPG